MDITRKHGSTAGGDRIAAVDRDGAYLAVGRLDCQYLHDWPWRQFHWQNDKRHLHLTVGRFDLIWLKH